MKLIISKVNTIEQIGDVFASNERSEKKEVENFVIPVSCIAPNYIFNYGLYIFLAHF